MTATSGDITHTAQVNLVVSTSASDVAFTSSRAMNTCATADQRLLLTPGTFRLSRIDDRFRRNNGTAFGTCSGHRLRSEPVYLHFEHRGSITPGSLTLRYVRCCWRAGRLSVIVYLPGAQTSHEVDFPIYVVAQPTIFSYIAPLTIRQGAGCGSLYEVASTSTRYGAQLYLGPGWPQAFWLNPIWLGSNPKLTRRFTVARKLKELIVSRQTRDAATGTSNSALEFAVDNLSQVVPVPTQVVPFTDFSVAAEPTTIGLASGGTQTVTISASAVNGFSSPVNVSMDSLPSGLQASPQAFTLEPGNSQVVTLTAAPIIRRGVLSVDATSGVSLIQRRLPFLRDLSLEIWQLPDNTFTAFGIAQIYTSGTYEGSITPPDQTLFVGSLLGILPVTNSGSGFFTVPENGNVSNCGGVTTNAELHAGEYRSLG